MLTDESLKFQLLLSFLLIYFLCFHPSIFSSLLAFLFTVQSTPSHIKEHVLCVSSGYVSFRRMVRESWCSVLRSLQLLLLSPPWAECDEKAAIVPCFWGCLKKLAVKENKPHCHCCNIRICIWEWNIPSFFTLRSRSVFIEARVNSLLFVWGSLSLTVSIQREKSN